MKSPMRSGTTLLPAERLDCRQERAWLRVVREAVGRALETMSPDRGIVPWRSSAGGTPRTNGCDWREGISVHNCHASFRTDTPAHQPLASHLNSNINGRFSSQRRRASPIGRSPMLEHDIGMCLVCTLCFFLHAINPRQETSDLAYTAARLSRHQIWEKKSMCIQQQGNEQ